MPELLELGTTASPFAHRVFQPRLVSVDDAERDSVKVFYGSCSKRKAFGALMALALLFLTGYNLLYVHGIPRATEFKFAGAGLLLISATGIAYVVYELRRNQRVFILKDAFAIERRFTSEVELFKWTDVTKLYCLDRTTRTQFYVMGFIPVNSVDRHQGRLTIALADGRRLVITNRIRDFSTMANQFNLRTMAAQLAPCSRFLLEGGGTLDFGKFGLTENGLLYKGRLINWDDIQSVSLSHRNILLFQTVSRWRSPRFNLETIPNTLLLFEMLSLLGVQWVQES